MEVIIGNSIVQCKTDDDIVELPSFKFVYYLFIFSKVFRMQNIKDK